MDENTVLETKPTVHWSQIDLCWPHGSHGPELETLTAWLTLVGVEGTEDISSAESQGLRFFVPPSQSSQKMVSIVKQLLQTHYGEHAEMFTFYVESIEEKDWMQEWKKHFDVLALSEHVWICPSWKEFSPAPGQFLVRMDPGMAFGTGHHASTRLIAQALEDHLQRLLRPSEPLEVLDVGTGTGVLAMSAALLGATRVLAIDVDTEAVEIARKNVLINGLADRIEVSDLPIDRVRRKFSIIVANILAETHVDLMPAYTQRALPGAVLLLSGIIVERSSMVRSRLQELGWAVFNERMQGEWVCLVAVAERRKAHRA